MTSEIKNQADGVIWKIKYQYDNLMPLKDWAKIHPAVKKYLKDENIVSVGVSYVSLTYTGQLDAEMFL